MCHGNKIPTAHHNSPNTLFQFNYFIIFNERVLNYSEARCSEDFDTSLGVLLFWICKYNLDYIYIYGLYIPSYNNLEIMTLVWKYSSDLSQYTLEIENGFLMRDDFKDGNLF